MFERARFSPADVLPHGPAMILLDEIAEWSDDRLVARLSIKESSLFLTNDDVVPAWIGLEYIAQAIAAWAGIQAKRNDGVFERGYLIGARSYTASRDSFVLGETLEVTVTRIAENGPLGLFYCEIHSDHCSVEARVSVYRAQTAAPNGKPVE